MGYDRRGEIMGKMKAMWAKWEEKWQEWDRDHYLSSLKNNQEEDVLQHNKDNSKQVKKVRKNKQRSK
tara:strand:- start:88 stop:288 length:201 start_codon:yes stop_codon:yes gene_type:complete